MGLLDTLKAFATVPRRNSVEPQSQRYSSGGLPIRLQEITVDVSKSSAVIACFNVIDSAVNAGKLEVIDADGNVIVGHELPKMMSRELITHILRSAYFYQNGLVAIIKYEGSAEVAKLEPLSARYTRIGRSYRNGNQFNGYNKYEYRRPGQNPYIFIDTEVFHFVLQPDDDKPWLGVSPLIAAIDDLKTDKAARAFTVSAMGKHFSASQFIQPSESGAGNDFTDEQMTAIRTSAELAYSGGEVQTAFVSPIKVDRQDLKGPRDFANTIELILVPEARISGIMQTPARRAGFYVGLKESNTYATAREENLQFAEGTVRPLQDKLAAAMTAQLLPFFAASDGLTVRFNNDDNYFFSKDLDAVFERYGKAFERNGITLDEYRAAIGQKPAISNGGRYSYQLQSDTPQSDRPLDIAQNVW